MAGTRHKVGSPISSTYWKSGSHSPLKDIMKEIDGRSKHTQDYEFNLNDNPESAWSKRKNLDQIYGEKLSSPKVKVFKEDQDQSSLILPLHNRDTAKTSKVYLEFQKDISKQDLKPKYSQAGFLEKIDPHVKTAQKILKKSLQIRADIQNRNLHSPLLRKQDHRDEERNDREMQQTMLGSEMEESIVLANEEDYFREASNTSLQFYSETKSKKADNINILE